MRDFLMRSNDFALAADTAGFTAVQAAATAQRDTLVKARSAEVDSMGISQVRADGEVTLSALRTRIEALKGRTTSDEDTRIQAALTKTVEAIKGDDKEAITNSLVELNSTVSLVEAAVQKRENPTPEVTEEPSIGAPNTNPVEEAPKAPTTDSNGNQQPETNNPGNSSSQEPSTPSDTTAPLNDPPSDNTPKPPPNPDKDPETPDPKPGDPGQPPAPDHAADPGAQPPAAPVNDPVVP